MIYLIKFDADGNRTTTYADTVHFDYNGGEAVGTTIDVEECLKEGFIFVNEADYQKLLGNVPEGVHIYKDGEFVPAPEPEPDMKALKAAKLDEVRRITAEHIVGGFYSRGVRYDSDLETQTTMQGIRQSVDSPRFAEEYPNGCPVRGYDKGATVKTIHYLDASAVNEFCDDMNLHIGKCKEKGWLMQEDVKAAKTEKDLEAIRWPREE